MQAKITLGVLLAVQAVFVASTFSTWIACLTFLALVTVFVIARHQGSKHFGATDSNGGTDGSTRRLLWRVLFGLLWFVVFAAIGVVTFVWRMGDQSSETFNPVLVAIDAVAHTALFASLVIWMMRPGNGHVAMLALGLIVLLMGVAAGGASRSIASQTTVAIVACIGFPIGAQVIMGSRRGTQGKLVARGAVPNPKARFLGPALSFFTLSLLLISSSLVARATNEALPSIQQELQKQLHVTLESVAQQSGIGGTRYVRSGRIGALHQHMIGDPQQTALHIVSDVKPGYLRGRIYEAYEGRSWHVLTDRRNSSRMVRDRTVLPVSKRGVRMSLRSARYVRQFSRFSLLHPSSQSLPGEPEVELQVYTEPQKGAMVFLPMNARWIEGNVDQLDITAHSSVRSGIDSIRPYIAGVGMYGLREDLDPELRRTLLYVPEQVADISAELAEELCDQPSTAPAKARAVSGYFQSQFAYDLRITVSPPRVDPIDHFLRLKHPAHCEYFATATAVVLRSAGIPTRYVTGYVADERSENDDSVWLARNRDAHAWVEAYDEVTEQWFPVESTPGRTYETINSKIGGQDDEGFFDALDRDFGNQSDSLAARLWAWTMQQRTSDYVVFFFRYALLPVFCLLGVLVWSRYFGVRRLGSDPIDIQSLKMLRHVDRLFGRLNLVRGPSETLYQFADRIESSESTSDSNAGAHQLRATGAAWYRAFANARYQGQKPEPFAL